MRFAIRDDDTSYFTEPRQLDEVYGGLWDRYPVSIAVVPFHGCTVSAAIPQTMWTGTETYPLHHNSRLVRYLRRQVRRKRASILLHGFDHVDRDGRSEFDSHLDAESLAERISLGRDYLEDLLETSIRTFVPPHNTMSRAGLEALSRLRMNVLGSFSFRPWRRPLTPSALAPLARRRLFLWRQRWQGWPDGLYPYPLAIDGHLELACHDLNRDPSCLLENLLLRLDRTVRVDGDFCLATHYWELKEPSLYGWLARLLERATSRGAEFVHADDLLGSRAAASDRGEAA